MKFANLTTSQQPWNPDPFGPIKGYAWDIEVRNRMELQDKLAGQSQAGKTRAHIEEKFPWLEEAMEQREMPLTDKMWTDMIHTSIKTYKDLVDKDFYRCRMAIVEKIKAHQGPVSYDLLMEWCAKYKMRKA
jgi:hypothetical protein